MKLRELWKASVVEAGLLVRQVLQTIGRTAAKAMWVASASEWATYTSAIATLLNIL